jgi:periplasmic protein TonB
MFEQTILAGRHRGRRFWATCLGVAGEALLVVFMVVAPMLWPQVLPRPQNWIALYTPSAPLPAAKNAPKPRNTHVEPSRTANLPHPFTTPVSMPPRAAILAESPVDLAPVGIPNGVDTGGGPGGGGGILNGILDTARPMPAVPSPEMRPVAPPKETAAPPKRIRIGHLEPGKLLAMVKPVYPPLAKTARVSGTVELEAVIGIDGRLKEIRMKSGNPLLVPAAVEAVSHWVYRPTVLNGDPVEVVTSILVNFSLGQ